MGRVCFLGSGLKLTVFFHWPFLPYAEHSRKRLRGGGRQKGFILYFVTTTQFYSSLPPVLYLKSPGLRAGEFS